MADRSRSPMWRLGFREIVPGADRVEPGGDEVIGPSQVPKFDLAAGIMANDRKLVAATRRGPGRGKTRTAFDTDDLQDAPQVAVAVHGHDVLPGPTEDPIAGIPQTVDAQEPASRQETVVPPARPVARERVWRPAMTDAQRRVIAGIVARDIGRLCRGEWVLA